MGDLEPILCALSPDLTLWVYSKLGSLVAIFALIEAQDLLRFSVGA